MYVPIIQFPDQLLYHLRLNVHSVFGLGADGERSGSKTTTSIRSGMLTLDYLEYPVEIMEGICHDHEFPPELMISGFGRRVVMKTVLQNKYQPSPNASNNVQTVTNSLLLMNLES